MLPYRTRFQARLQAQQEAAATTNSVITVVIPTGQNQHVTTEIHIVRNFLDQIAQTDCHYSKIMLNIELFSYLVLHPSLIMENSRFRKTLRDKVCEYYQVISSEKENLKRMTLVIPDDHDELHRVVKQAKIVAAYEHLEMLCHLLYGL